MSIYTLGPAGSYSHFISQKLFPDTKINFALNLQTLFEEVKNNKNHFGVVPLENMIEGTVRETFDLLYESELQIWDILQLPINHCLAAQNKKFKTISSHEQALAQCRNTLNKKYKKLNTQNSFSTSSACQLAQENSDFAAITNKFAADMYNLQIIDQNISDYPNNKTKFAVISSKPNPKTSLNTLAALTPINPDEPGLLIKMLFPFQENQVNLTKIESRPNKKNLNQYIFYIEFEGDARQARARKILTYLEKDLQICKVKTFGGQVTTNNLIENPN